MCSPHKGRFGTDSHSLNIKPLFKSIFRLMTLRIVLFLTLGLFTSEFSQFVLAQTVPGSTFNVRTYGAKGDGKSLDSPAINRAINAAAEKGGGTIFFPAGTYRSFSIRLKSNITLHFEAGSILLAASPNDGDGRYDPPEPNAWDKYQDFGHSHWRNSLIWGENLENVAILGPGMIWGKGLVRGGEQPRTKKQNDALSGFKADPNLAPFGYPNPRDAVEPDWGNKAISLKLSRNVTIRDISMLHGGHFAILATGVDNLTIDNVKIDTDRDGIDIDACRNVRLSNVSVNSPFDDAIVLKSSFALGFARATENVTITNCYVSGYEEGSLLDGTYKHRKRDRTGRIKFGTESNGGFKNITISNCVFDSSWGLALESVDGGSLEDVTISNITMRDVLGSPIFLRLGARMRRPKEETSPGALRRVSISNVIAYNVDPRYGSIISGTPKQPIEDVTLNNIRIYYRGGGTKEQAGLSPPENDRGYPEPTMFGEMPSYGFFIRHVNGIQMTDIHTYFLSKDLRPAYLLNDVKDADFFRIKTQLSPGVPMFVFRDVENFSVRQSPPLKDTRVEKATYRELSLIP